MCIGVYMYTQGESKGDDEEDQTAAAGQDVVYDGAGIISLLKDFELVSIREAIRQQCKHVRVAALESFLASCKPSGQRMNKQGTNQYFPVLLSSGYSMAAC